MANPFTLIAEEYNPISQWEMPVIRGDNVNMQFREKKTDHLCWIYSIEDAPNATSFAFSGAVPMHVLRLCT